MRVQGLCRKLLRSEADADDATQDVMLRAWKAWPRFRAGSDPWPWLAMIAANVCRDAGRHEMRAAAHAPALATEDRARDTYDEVAGRARTALVTEALADVPATYRTALYLRDIEGWSVSDIAKLRGRTVPAVRSSLSRARKILAARVEELARERKQWPLPAALPAVAAVRTRMRRLKTGLDRIGLAGAEHLDAVVLTLQAAPIRTASQVAAAVAAAAVFVASSAGVVTTAEASPAPSFRTSVAVAAPDAPATVDAVTPTEPETASVVPPRRGPVVTATEPALADDGRTATPAATAEPGADVTPIAPEEQLRIVVGPVAVDCRGADRFADTWAAVCGAAAQG